MKVIIVGGVAGGASAAARLRRLDETAQIVIYEKSGFVSYANCGLPYYIGDVITDKGRLTVQTPESLWSRFKIKVKVFHEVTDIDPDKKTVTVKNITDGTEWTEQYDKLLLSPGAKPVKPDLAGMDSDRIFTLRTVEDTIKIHDHVKNLNPESVIIVGGGYIGIEVAENLKEKGLKVTIIQKPDQLMNTIDYDMAAFVHGKLRAKGITIKLNSTVTGFCERNGKVAAMLEGESGIEADMVLLAIGVAPENNLAKKAGLKIGVKGSIIVNDRMETSVPDIYAVGDAVTVKNYITGVEGVIALAGPANKQGRIAADNICGGNSCYVGTMGTSVIKIFDMTVAATGLTGKAARAAGIDYESVVLFPSSHADYYPGAKTMIMKVVYDKTSRRLLGAQIIGAEGADKRLDVLAAAISGGIPADRLKDLELAYAPPFSSAKDPVNMAGFMIENILNGYVKQYHWYEDTELPRDGSVTLLDVRTADEYENGHIDGYKNIPVDVLRDRLNEVDITKPVYVVCQSGLRGYVACRILSQTGYDCYNMSGGYMFYAGVMREKSLNENTYPCGMEKQMSENDYKYSDNKIRLKNKEGKTLAFIEFPEFSKGKVEVTHTVVDPSLQGQGIAGRLTELMANKLRAEGKKAELTCSYAIKWFNKNREYSDVLIDPETEYKKAGQVSETSCGIPKHR
ncbi:MAG: FAD-dependent oxidoreductase [Lachnospiraceae bacterium]|nr:FAD-dependent oxidoreductase [Lachnospiraceae bacterium]